MIKMPKKPYPILESYSWLTSDMTVNDAPGNKVIIRGPALFSFEKFFEKGISRNKRRYIQSEVIRSARTLKNVPIDVNHEISLWEERGKIGPKPTLKGHVIFGEEEDGKVEYTAEVNHKEYAQKIRDTDAVRKGRMTEKQYFAKWLKAPIVGVSVDADFLKLTCSRCGDTFEVFELYKEHMSHAHGIKDVSLQPFGITFKRLSLVEPPEEPGVMGADFEIVETAHSGMYKLYESITSHLKETENMKKTKKEEKRKKVKETKTPAYLKAKEDLDIGDTDVIVKQPEVADGQPAPLAVVEPPEAEVIVPERPEGHCADGFHWDEDSKTCIPDKIEDEPLPPETPLGPTLEPAPLLTLEQDATTVPTEPEAPTIPTEPKCEEGSHYDKELGACVPDGADLGTEPQTIDTPITEFKLPAKLRLGEPFANYADFDDCVSKNQDKEDPAAYCASIKQKTEGDAVSEVKKTPRLGDIYETFEGLHKDIKELRTQTIKRDVKNAEAINQLNEAIAKWHTDTKKFLKNLNNEILLESRLRGGYDSRIWKWMKELQNRAKAINARINKAVASVNKGFTQLTTYEKKLAETFNKNNEALKTAASNLREYTDKKLTELATAQAKLNANVNQFNLKINEVAKNLKVDTDKINTQLAGLGEKIGDTEEYGRALEDLRKQWVDFKKAKEQEDEEKPEHTCPDGEHWSEAEGKCVPNESVVAEIKKLTEIMTARMDNVESKVKGDFKAHHKPVGKKDGEELDAEPPYK